MWRLLVLLFTVIVVGANRPYPPQPPQCSQHCPPVDCQPVCASCPEGGNVTFGSDCELDCQNERYTNNQCVKLHDGQCGMCDVVCEDVDSPVCAICYVPADGSYEPETFGNFCELNWQITCDTKNYANCTFLFDGICGERPDVLCDDSFCEEVYKPVCASCWDEEYHTTFGNECELLQNNLCATEHYCTKVHDGQCPPICADYAFCPVEKKPVCAICDDGREVTFRTDCELSRQNTCDPSKQCTKICDGECGRPCNISCPEIYQPICAVCDEGGEITFGNECELDRQNTCYPSNKCANISKGECSPKCDIACPLLYQPLCALCKDGERTFGNDCELDRQNVCNSSNQCTKVSDGKCTPPCNIACPFVYQPLCAMCNDGAKATFGNNCTLHAHNACNPDNQCSKISDGECSPSCDIACPLVYQPLCALCNDGERTFENDCELSRQNDCNPSNQCTKIGDGKCSSPCDTPCPLTLVYQPVCALCNDGETTFGGECELNRQNICNPHNQCTKISDGKCSPLCDIYCLAVYEPVCALCNDGTKATFGNDCELNRHNACNGSNQCTQLHTGECTDGNPCADIEEPVCAYCPYGNQTFRNKCYLEQHNHQTGEDCSYVQDGPCKKPSSCVKFCPFYDIALCAICNGHKFQTFPNTCFMDNHNCQTDDNCRNISQGIGKTCPPQHPPKSPSSPLCDQIFCPAIREPVCAQCGAITKTFENGCALGVHNCKYDHECVRISSGVCPQEECSEGRNPVCATCNNEQRTFQNKCILDSYKALYPQDNCRKQYDGQCQIECLIQYRCSTQYEPICALCGVEERTFDNECIFKSFNCPAGNECIKLRDGACEPVSPGEPQCPRGCTKEYKPVCANCPNGQQTFGNLCLFKQNNCQSKPGCSFIRDGQCETVNPGGPICPSGCTREYNPICAQCPNGQQTFNNLCLLQQNNCQSRGGCNYLRDGRCTDACSLSCPSNFAPVCAVCANNNYKTFPNTCEMERHNCRTNENCQYVGDGSSSCPPVQPGGPIVDPGFPTSPSECAAVLCSTKQDYLCAKCGPTGTLQTFTNGCLFRIHNCFNNQECNEIYKGKCRETPTPIICSINRNPVCANTASGPRTFQNECFFNSYAILNPQENCTKLHAGVCKTTCPLYKCIVEYKPVCALCGFEQRTFSNECFFNSYNCPAGYECIKIKDGACSSLPPLICTGEYEPVCASCSYGYATFANACFMRAENIANPASYCVERMQGPCGSTCPQERCSDEDESSFCAQCGDRKLTFQNQCGYNSYNCKCGYTCKILNSGECYE